MSDLNLHDTMIDRAARVLLANLDNDPHEAARRVIEAAFSQVPMSNYSIGTLLKNFDLVIVVKEHPHSAAAGVYRRSAQDPAETFDSLGHNITVDWKQEPTRHISGVRVHKLDAPST